jgi:energy-coupling factor transport system permease protein
MLAVLLTRNPFYLGLALCAVLVVNAWLDRSVVAADRSADGAEGRDDGGPDPDPVRRGRGALLRLVLGLLVVVALFKWLSLHVGATVLFRLPEEWPLIGGPITLEALVFCGLDALSLVATLAVFAVFSAGADYYALLRSVPPFMHQVGLVVSIAITFVPQTVTRFAEIREAQALRGHRVRRAGDLLPLVMPLLAGGMERSMNLAEAMEARGFSAPAGTRHARGLPPVAVQCGLVLGLGLVLVGAALPVLWADVPWAGWAALWAGLLLVGATLWAAGRGTGRTRYRRAVWKDVDTALVVVSLAVVGMLLAYRLTAPAELVYDPLARLRVYAPGFDPLLAAAFAALAAPVPVAHIWKDVAR